MPVWLPLVDPVNLVESDDEGNFLLLEHVQRLDGLRLEAMHDVDDEDGDVAEGGAAVAKVRERFVAGSVDNQEAR